MTRWPNIGIRAPFGKTNSEQVVETIWAAKINHEQATALWVKTTFLLELFFLTLMHEKLKASCKLVRSHWTCVSSILHFSGSLSETIALRAEIFIHCYQMLMSQHQARERREILLWNCRKLSEKLNETRKILPLFVKFSSLSLTLLLSVY